MKLKISQNDFYYNKIPKAIKTPYIMNSGIAEGHILPELLIRF